MMHSQSNECYGVRLKQHNLLLLSEMQKTYVDIPVYYVCTYTLHQFWDSKMLRTGSLTP